MPNPEPLPESNSPSRRHSPRKVVPGTSAQADGLDLRSYDVGALPLLTRIFERIQLPRILQCISPRMTPEPNSRPPRP